ncbi:MAG: DNA-3-methyladenine glycosylase 2 family protein, partial [Sphingobacteriales bacterium]
MRDLYNIYRQLNFYDHQKDLYRHTAYFYRMNPGTRLSLPANGIFNFEECLWFLNRDYDDCMHSIDSNTLHKATRIDEKPCLLSITGDDKQIQAIVLQGETGHREGAAAFIRQWFDLDRDLTPFYTLLQTHKKLAYMADSFYGLRRIGIPDIFEALCWSIIGQQINLSFAYRMKRRLTERYGTHLSYEGKQHWLFPQPAVLAGADVDELRAMQFSQKKAEYLIGLAQLFASGKLSRAILES